MNKLKKSLMAIFTAGVLSLPFSVSSRANAKELSYPNTLYETDLTTSSYISNPTTQTIPTTEQFNLERILSEHKVSIEYRWDDSVKPIVELRRAEDGKVFAKDRFDGKDEITFSYLPRRFYLEFKYDEDDENPERTSVIETKILKTILVDRDNKIEKKNSKGKTIHEQHQQMYLIEGDEFNPFGAIVGKSLVSTGLPHFDEHPGGDTALGYFYVQRKKELSTNKRFGWVMPFALWYEKESGMMEGQNGIHAYEHTHFGRIASHGCVREPKAFAKHSYKWANVGTPVIIIGNIHERDEDPERFNLRDYDGFKLLLNNLEFNTTTTSSTLTTSNVEALSKLSPMLLEMRNQARTHIARYDNPGFNDAVESFIGK